MLWPACLAASSVWSDAPCATFAALAWRLMVSLTVTLSALKAIERFCASTIEVLGSAPLTAAIALSLREVCCGQEDRPAARAAGRSRRRRMAHRRPGPVAAPARGTRA